MKLFKIVGLLFFIFFSTYASAWNLGVKHIKALRFQKNGNIEFSLFESGARGESFTCAGSNTWFRINNCSTNDSVCVSAVDRMSKLLTSAALARKPVYLEREGCTVTEVAIRGY